MRFFLCLLACCITFSQTAVAEEIRTALTPMQAAKLAAPMSGQIIKVGGKDGDWIKKGQTLISFECEEQRARVSQTNARVARHKSLYKAAKEMFELEAIGAVELNVKKADYNEAMAERALAQANLNKCSIKAPFDGRIGQLDAKAYDIVQQGQPLIDILNDSRLQAEMIVPSKWLSFLKPGYEFDLYIDETAASYPSKIIRIGGRVDPVTQSVKAYAEIDNKNNNLLAGMSGVAKITDPNTEIDTTETEQAPQNGAGQENTTQHP